jgi:hypothetical protein
MLTIVTLKEWYGRLGNNLTQLVNAIYFAKQNKHIFICNNVKYPKHALDMLEVYDGLLEYIDNKPTLQSPFIKNFTLSFADKPFSDTMSTISSLPILSDFFYDNNNITVPNTVVSNGERRTILKKYILPNFNYKKDETLTKDTLVIHIRSGDIFNSGTHSFYVQPPFSFYYKVITENNYTNILIITEKDRRNPTIQMILDNFDNVSIKDSKLEEDINIILSAENFVCNSQGTFGFYLALMSCNIKNLFISYFTDPDTTSFNNNNFLSSENTKSFMDTSSITDINIHRFLMHNYIQPFGWNPSDPNQQHSLKFHPLDQIVKLES